MTDLNDIIGRMKRPLFLVSLQEFGHFCIQIGVDTSDVPGTPREWMEDGRRFLIKGTGLYLMISASLPYTEDNGDVVNLQVLDMAIMDDIYKRPLVIHQEKKGKTRS